MASGLPYDSDAGPRYAGGHHLADVRPGVRDVGAASPSGWARSPATRRTREPFLGVIRKHRKAAYQIDADGRGQRAASRRSGGRGTRRSTLGSEHGFRNSQVTVLAPTGTIGFMMDCDTTGIEPDIALIKYKKLVGGGMLKIVNNTVPLALQQLGYTHDRGAGRSSSYLDEKDTIEGAPGLKAGAPAGVRLRLQPAKGERTIHYMGHLRMMAPAQPFLSGAISQDGEPAERRHGRGHRGGLPRGVEARAQGGRGLPRRLQAQPAAQHLRKEKDDAAEAGGGGPASRRSAAERRRLPDERRSHHPQVLHRRPRGLPHGRHVRGRHAGRAVRA